MTFLYFTFIYKLCVITSFEVKVNLNYIKDFPVTRV
jgi:hypothetical protein